MKAAWTVLLLLAAGGAALAHDEKFSSSRIEVTPDGLRWSVDVSVQGLGKVLTLPARATDLSPAQFQMLEPQIVEYLRSCLHVTLNGREVPAEAGATEALTEIFVASGESYIAHARQEFRFRSATPVTDVRLAGSLFSSVTDQHHAVLMVAWNGARRSFSRYGSFELDLTPRRVQPTFWSTSSEFIVWGMHHIFIGYDHIAFLLALLLGARTLGEVVRVATSFTVAHSFTLLLAAVDVLRVPSALTESLIAASIVYVAAENFFIKDARHRWVLTFLFGLVHGLGFSSVLHERLQDLDSIVLPVVSFNLGVEVGQLAILLVAFPVLAWIRNGVTEAETARRQWRLVRFGSTPILLLGSFWLADRVLQKGWMPF